VISLYNSSCLFKESDLTLIIGGKIFESKEKV